MLKSMAFAILLATAAVVSARAEIRGHYLETRTCMVYTGPCFANGEMGLAGKDAVMAWSIQEGTHNGVDLAGLKVIVALNSSTTLGHQGLDEGEDLKSVVYVDQKASGPQREALLAFARTHSGKAGQYVVHVESMPIEMTLDEVELKANLDAGNSVKIETRKVRPTDCICSNEFAFYPPLAKVQTCVPGVTSTGVFSGRGLGSSWSTPDSPSAYLARFAY
jgi:hypothetical protein